MLDSDLITMPSFRPDGRLDRLNSGGGSLKDNVNAWKGDMRRYQKETGQSPAAGNGKFTKDYVNWSNSQGVSGVSKPPPASSGGGAQAQQQQAAPAPTAAGPMYTEKKKRRTLLSGGALNQDQNGTILGAV